MSTIECFNRVYRDFVKEIAEIFPECKLTIIRRYDDLLNNQLEDDAYVNEFMKAVQDKIEYITQGDDKLFDSETPLYFLRDIDFRYIWKQKMTETTRIQIRKYLKTLYVIGVKIVSVSDDIDEIIKGFYSDNLDVDKMSGETKRMVDALKSIAEDKKAEAPASVTQYEQMITGSSIGKLAQEIAGEIDIDGLKLDDIKSPSDVMSHLMGGNFKNLIENVGSKIQAKLQQGDLDPSKLVGEAHQMMSMLGASNQLNQMFQVGTGSNTNAGNSSNDRASRVKERLRKKLKKNKK